LDSRSRFLKNSSGRDGIDWSKSTAAARLNRERYGPALRELPSQAMSIRQRDIGCGSAQELALAGLKREGSIMRTVAKKILECGKLANSTISLDLVRDGGTY
jgi:hypothetical protein